MKRLGVFVTPEELESVRVQQSCSGMFLSGGMPLGDPGATVEQLRRKYNLPETVAFDPSNGEFVEPQGGK